MPFKISGDASVQRNFQFGSVSNSQKANIVSNSGSVIWSTDNARLEVSDGSVFSPLGGAAIAELVNSSGTPYVNSLSGATGSGEVKFFVNQDISDTATLTVPSGQSLNGVVDGTFLFSNYDNNTQFRVDDVAPSGWAVSVVGAPTESVRPYGYAELTVQNIVSELGLSLDDAQLNYTMSVDNDASPGSPVPFFAGRADGMTFIPATAATFPDGFSLNIGSTIESSFRIEQDGNYTVQYKMPNPENSTIDDGGLVPLAVLIDTDGTTILSAKASPSEDSADSAFCQFDFEGVQAGQYIQVGVTTTDQDNSGGDTIDISVPIDADDPQAADIDSMVHANVTIFKNNTTETVLAGMVTPTPLSYFSVDLLADQTIGNADIDIVFDNVDFDPDSGFNTGTGEYTIPAGKGGLWMFGGALSFKNNGTAGDDPRTVDLMVNGVVSDSIRINPEAITNTEAQPVTISSLRQVSEGDVIKLRVSSGANTVVLDETSGFWGKEQVTSSVADPDSVPVEDLHLVSLNVTDGGNSVPQVATTIGAGYEVCDLSDADLVTYDPQGLVTLADNSLTITQDGTYSIYFAGRTSSNSDSNGAVIYLNGSPIAAGRGQDGGSQTDANSSQVIKVLTAGDKLEFGTDFVASGSFTGVNITLQQIASKTITTAPSGVLQAENLTASRFSLSADSGSVVVCPFDTTDYNEDTSRYALQGGGGVLVQPGRYLVTVKPSRQGALLDWELWNNTAGSQVMQGRMDHAGGIDNTDQSTTYLTLSSASEIQLRELDGDASVVWNGNSDLYGCTMEFVQLPETQYVNPSGVPVEDVEVTLFSGSATDGANVLDGGVTWDDVVANYEYVKVSNISANFVRSAAEVYTADLTLGTTIIGWSVGNGASASVTTTSGSGAFTLTGGTGTLRITGVRAQKTVINTTDTPTDDQAASGYFDVGTMRIQWGQFTTGSNVVTAFPAPFADTSYSIVANTQSTGDDPHTVSFYNKTTTQVESDGWKADDRTPATFTAGFIAIGLKP